MESFRRCLSLGELPSRKFDASWVLRGVRRRAAALLRQLQPPRESLEAWIRADRRPARITPKPHQPVSPLRHAAVEPREGAVALAE